MTLLVGIRCSDGVVMASDSAATYAAAGSPTIGQQNCTKVRDIARSILYSGTGAIGMSQVFENAIGELWRGGKFKAMGPAPAMHLIGQRFVQDGAAYRQSAAMNAQLIGQQAAGSTVLCASLVAMVLNKRPCLFQFSESGAPEEATGELPFVALGSGQPLADPFLAFLKRVLWEDREPTVADGRFVAAWTIRQVTRMVPAFVGGDLQLATLTTKKDGSPVIDFFDDNARDEHYQAVEAAEQALRERVRGTSDPEGAPDLPAPPEPE